MWGMRTELRNILNFETHGIRNIQNFRQLLIIAPIIIIVPLPIIIIVPIIIYLYFAKSWVLSTDYKYNAHNNKWDF